MNWKNLLAAIAVAVVALGTGIAAAAQCTADTPDLLDQIKQRGELRVGYVNSKPYVYKNLQTGELEGVVVEAAKMLTERYMKVKLTWVEAKWDTMIAGLQAQKYDVIMVNTGRGQERAEAVWFTEPWIMGQQAFLVRKQDHIHTLADLDKPGNTIVVLAGERAHAVYTKESPHFFQHATIKPVVPPAMPEQDVATGRAIAYGAGNIDVYAIAQANPDWSEMLILPEAPRANGAGFIVPQCQANLLQYMNVYLDTLIEGKFLYQWALQYGLPTDSIVAPRPTYGDLAAMAARAK